MGERWLPVVVWEEFYEVSDRGRVRRMFHGHWIYKNKNKRGKVELRAGKLYLYTRIGRLVLTAFKGPPPFPEAHARHLDDIKTNNVLANLEWGSALDNMADAKRNGRTCKGRKQSVKHRKALSIVRKGRIFSEEHKKALSDAQRRRYSNGPSGDGSFLNRT